MKSIVANVANAVGVIILITFAALFVIGCLCADDYAAPEIPAAMQNWNGGAR